MVRHKENYDHISNIDYWAPVFRVLKRAVGMKITIKELKMKREEVESTLK